MNLKYFTKEAYLSLKKDLEINKEKYYSNEEWLSEYFKEQGINEFYRESSLIVKDFELVYRGNSDEQKNADDLENIIRLYSACKDKISPAVASDPLLWAALCHMNFKKYVFDRWKKNDGSISLDQRFFATEGRTSLTYYNALSRLWWSGYLTYDEAANDPWELTKTLLSAQQIQKDLFDQAFSMNKNVVKGLLRALTRVQAKKRNACTPLFRNLCDSFFNHYGAVTSIDALTSDEIEEIAYEYMLKDIKIGKKDLPIELKDRIKGKNKKGSKKKRKRK